MFLYTFKHVYMKTCVYQIFAENINPKQNTQKLGVPKPVAVRLQATKLELLAALQDRSCKGTGRCDATADGQLLEQLLATTVQVGASTITLQPSALGALQGLLPGAGRPGAVFDRGASRVNAVADAPQAISRQAMPLEDGKPPMGVGEHSGVQKKVLDMVGDKCFYLTKVGCGGDFLLDCMAMVGGDC